MMESKWKKWKKKKALPRHIYLLYIKITCITYDSNQVHSQLKKKKAPKSCGLHVTKTLDHWFFNYFQTIYIYIVKFTEYNHKE